MIPFLFVIAALAAAAFWLIGVPMLKGERRVKLGRKPIPRQWMQWLEQDVAAGRLDEFADEALAEYERGETTEL